MQRVKQGDTIEVTAGKDKGLQGEVVRIDTKKNRVIVNGINIMKRHQKARPAPGGQQVPAQIVEFEAPFDLSNVMVICSSCEEKTRVGYRFTDDEIKTRYCKKCDSDIE